MRSDRMESPRVQFSARATEKSLNLLPPLKLDHVNALTDDTGMLQHAIFTIPNRAEGYTTDDNARALIFTMLLSQLRGTRRCLPPRSAPTRIGPSATWHFSSTPSIPRRKGSETSSATTAAGWKSRDRKILTAAPCGRLEPSWADRQIPDCGALPGVCSSTRCRPWSEFHSPAGLRLRGAWNPGIPPFVPWETATPSACDSHWLKGCSLCISRSIVQTGSGLKMWWHTETQGFPRLCCWRDRLAGMNRMLSAGLDSLEWLMDTQRCPDQQPLCAHRLAGVLPPRRRTSPVRSAAGGSRRRSVGLSTGLPRDWR